MDKAVRIKANRPERCPQCKSPYWDVLRQKLPDRANHSRKTLPAKLPSASDHILKVLPVALLVDSRCNTCCCGPLKPVLYIVESFFRRIGNAE
jgi:hypothetical protein